MAPIEILQIYRDVTNLIVSNFMERFCVLQVLNEERDPVVVSKLVEDVGTVEGGGLYEEEEGDPLIVRMEDGLLVAVLAGSHPGVDPGLPLAGEGEGVGDVAVRVEGGLADKTVRRTVSG